MKTKTFSTLIVILVFFSMENYSQDYRQIIDTSSKWSILTSYSGVNSTHFIRFGLEDTLIGGLPYRKVYNTYDPDEQNWLFMDVFVREDTVNRQVYLRNLIGEEGLIYDFSIEIGDTVTINNVLSGSIIQMKVVDVDSILINDEYRKQFHFEPVNWPFWDTWVEGIGSLGQGILYSGWYNTSPWYTLICYKQNEIVYYMTPGYTACYYPYVSVDETYSNNLKVFYNHTINCIEIRNTGTNIQNHFELYTVFGQRILHKPITGNTQINLGKYGLADGIYIYSLKNKKNLFTDKIQITKN